MDNELIERLAREAGAWTDEIVERPGRAARLAALRRFAALVAEDAAKACEDLSYAPIAQSNVYWRRGAQTAAEMIRAKFKEQSNG